MTQRAVVAIGGNSLIPSGEEGTFEQQLASAERACTYLLPFVERGLELVLTHGNGPQVGRHLLRVELSSPPVVPLPLHVCVADTQGSIGFMLQHAMGNVLRERGIARAVGTVVTQVLVDQRDPAFEHPTKPVGPSYEARHADRLRRRGWTLAEDSGRGYRRLVPSPVPKRVIEKDLIHTMAASGVLVIAAGGGGVPVIEETGRLQGVDAVVDKDRASSLLAAELGADLLLIATDVDGVYLDYGTPRERLLDELEVSEAEAHLAAGQFPPGNMGPKIEGAIDYLRRGGEQVVIAHITDLDRALAGRAGTRVIA